MAQASIKSFLVPKFENSKTSEHDTQAAEGTSSKAQKLQTSPDLQKTYITSQDSDQVYLTVTSSYPDIATVSTTCDNSTKALILQNNKEWVKGYKFPTR